MGSQPRQPILYGLWVVCRRWDKETDVGSWGDRPYNFGTLFNNRRGQRSRLPLGADLSLSKSKSPRFS